MKKITIELDCGDKNCEKCHFQYRDIKFKQHTYCDLLNCYLGDSSEGPIERADRCLEIAEAV
jgi:hypothetical protein